MFIIFIYKDYLLNIKFNFLFHLWVIFHLKKKPIKGFFLQQNVKYSIKNHEQIVKLFKDII